MERDWKKDKDFVEEHSVFVIAGKMPIELAYKELRRIARYWLQQARELKAENADLLAVAEAARNVVDHFEAHHDIQRLAAALSELDVALLKAGAWLTGRQIEKGD